MNTPIENSVVDAFMLLAIHSTWMIGLAWLVSCLIKNTFMKRNLWRGTILSLGLLVLCSFSGMLQWNGFKKLETSNPEPKHLDVFIHQPALWKNTEMIQQNGMLTEGMAFDMSESHRTETIIRRSLGQTDFLLTVYVTGACCVSLLMLVNALWWRRYILVHAAEAPDSLKILFRQSALELNFKKSPKLLHNSLLKSPLVMGFMNPVMAFPGDFQKKFSHAEQSLIMSHEIAHLRERDGLWQCYSNLAIILLWWQPLAWCARWKLQQSTEETADAISARESTDRSQLAACLVRLGREMNGVRWSGSLSIFGAGFKSQLGKRVERLLNGKPEWGHAPNRLKWLIIQTTVMIAVLGLMMELSSRLSTTKSESVSSAFKNSLLGITLMAQASDSSTSHPLEVSQSYNKNQSNPPLGEASSTKPTTEPLPIEKQEDNETLHKLKSTVLPGFTIRRNDIWDNIWRLREAAIGLDPDLKKLKIKVTGSLRQENSTIQVTDHSVRATGHVLWDFNESPESRYKTASLNQNLSPLDRSNSFLMINVSVYSVLEEMLKSIGGSSTMNIHNKTITIDLPSLSSQRLYYPLETSEFKTNEPTSGSMDVESSNQPDHLLTRTYKINPETFIPRIRAITGALNRNGNQDLENQEANHSDIQNVIRQFAKNIGITNLQPKENQASKALYYNDRRGLLFVRLPPDDIDILEAAIMALQDRSETSRQIALDVQIVQLDVNGFNALKDMGFEGSEVGSKKQFEQVVDKETFERMYLRMQMDSGAQTLQSPRITTLDGRQSKMVAQEERTIVTTNQDGKLETERINTGPSMTLLPRILANGNIEISAKFELLEFSGYDDPGPAMIIRNTSNTSPQNLDTPDTDSANKDQPTNEDNRISSLLMKPDSVEITKPALPRFKRLELESTAQVKTGQTLIMGGLKTSHIIKHKSKIPILGDVPMLGKLFRNESIDASETFIYIFITPRIIDKNGYEL